jgi:hypothetical protein
MKTLNKNEQASERMLTLNASQLSTLNSQLVRAVPCTQQSTSTQAAHINQPPDYRRRRETLIPQSVSNFSSEKNGAERQLSATSGKQRQRTAREKGPKTPKPEKIQNHGVLIAEQQDSAPAQVGTLSAQKEKVSADMIANMDNQAGPLSPVENFITKKEVARRLGRGVRTIDSWKQLGLIPYYKVGKCVYFRWSEVQDAIARNGRRMN